MPYVAPLAECKFLFDHVVGFSDIRATVRFEDVSRDITDALLSEAGKVCEEVLAPLCRCRASFAWVCAGSWGALSS